MRPPVTAASALAVALVGASLAAAGPYHDPDHARGALPAADARTQELAALRADLDAMYAHRAAKLVRLGLDEDAIFAAAATELAAATTWAAYDEAIYAALAKFHDGHLIYKPPATAAPKVGYASWSLGLATVYARGKLLVASVEPGGDAAVAGVRPGDEVVAIDGAAVADELARVGASRAVSRPESAMTTYARTWTTVLYPSDQKTPRKRMIKVARRSGGAVVDIAITPVPLAKQKREVADVAQGGDVAIVTVHSLDGNRDRANQLDAVFAAARSAQAIVIDLRGDRGGVDVVGYRLVADLAEGAPSLGSFRVLLAPETLAHRPQWKALAPAGADNFSAPQPLTVAGLPVGGGFHGNVAVIVDAACASTCEVVTAALRADVHAIVVGDTTGGSSGAPVTIALPVSGASVAIPTWNLTSAEGKSIEDDGVAPDIDVAATPDALAAGVDLPLKTALDRVRVQVNPKTP